MAKHIYIFLLIPFIIKSQSSFNFGLYPKNQNSAYTWSDVGHFYISFAITVGISVIGHEMVFKRKESRIIKSVGLGGGSSLLLGWGVKEGVHDYLMNRGSATLNDFVNDFLGTGSGVIVCIAVFDTRSRRKEKEKAKFNRYKFGGN